MTKTHDLRGERIIDSRDVIARLAELESERQDAIDAAATSDGAWETEDGTRVSEDWLEDSEDEYQELKALDECGAADWQYGATLIREDYFEDYARELAEDIGALQNCDHWPATCIDWERAARELKADYSTVEFAGQDYLVRD